MDLQSTTALEILLLIAHGLCAYLKDRIDRSCAHGIPSVTGDAERDLNFLEKVGENTQKLPQDIQESWREKICKGLEWNLSSQITALTSTALAVLLIF